MNAWLWDFLGNLTDIKVGNSLRGDWIKDPKVHQQTCLMIASIQNLMLMVMCGV